MTYIAVAANKSTLTLSQLLCHFLCQAVIIVLKDVYQYRKSKTYVYVVLPTSPWSFETD